ncbi:hypothetical protein NQD34_015712 [Periophthalmus magnuspinnatus]|nr:hypothetical protein NQD34_015712 [Periophthalmus magnuspinnatus]
MVYRSITICNWSKHGSNAVENQAKLFVCSELYFDCNPALSCIRSWSAQKIIFTNPLSQPTAYTLKNHTPHDTQMFRDTVKHHYEEVWPLIVCSFDLEVIRPVFIFKQY